MRKCSVCGTEIPEARVKALPNTTTCVQHSTTERFGLNIVQHGTLEDDGFQEVEIIRNPRSMEQLNEYKKQLGNYK